MRNSVARELRHHAIDRQHYRQLKKTWSRTPRPLRDMDKLALAAMKYKTEHDSNFHLNSPTLNKTQP